MQSRRAAREQSGAELRHDVETERANRCRVIAEAFEFALASPNPTEAEVRAGMSGNLCRCTGYQNIVKAVLHAAAKLQQTQKEAA